MSDQMLSIEETDLKAHVQICAQRNKEVARKLSRIETMQWGILALLTAGGGVTLQQVIPIARALAGVP